MMQPGTTSATTAKVQNKNGQAIQLRDVQSVQLPDGWHGVDECELTYKLANGSEQRIPFSDILGFSDQSEDSNPRT